MTRVHKKRLRIHNSKCILNSHLEVVPDDAIHFVIDDDLKSMFSGYRKKSDLRRKIQAFQIIIQIHLQKSGQSQKPENFLFKFYLNYSENKLKYFSIFNIFSSIADKSKLYYLSSLY